MISKLKQIGNKMTNTILSTYASITLASFLVLGLGCPYLYFASFDSDFECRKTPLKCTQLSVISARFGLEKGLTLLFIQIYSMYKNVMTSLFMLSVVWFDVIYTILRLGVILNLVLYENIFCQDKGFRVLLVAFSQLLTWCILYFFTNPLTDAVPDEMKEN